MVPIVDDAVVKLGALTEVGYGLFWKECVGLSSPSTVWRNPFK